MFVTMCREAYDDFVRYRRDREVNSQQYKKLTKKGPAMFDLQHAVQFFKCCCQFVNDNVSMYVYLFSRNKTGYI